MACSSYLQLSPSVVGAVQWTLVGIEVLVLVYVVTWLARHSRVGRLVRPFRRRQLAGAEGGIEVGRASPARLVSMGGAARPDRGEPARLTPAAPRARGLRLSRTPARGHDAVGDAAASRMPAALHCPGCGTLLARGELATRLVTRCPGCDRRVAVRTDGERVIVALEG